MKLYSFWYGVTLERKIAIDLDRIILMRGDYDDYHELVISLETKTEIFDRRFVFPSKEDRDSVYHNILRASYTPVILPTRE